MRKPTLQDVARAAGVSYATADRVVNARGGVAAKSESRVRAAIGSLGYTRDLHAANLSRQRVYRFHVALAGAELHGFFGHLHAVLKAEGLKLAAERVQLELATVPAFAPEALAAHLDALDPAGLDAVALVAIEGPEVAAAIARLSAAGVPVVTLVADAPTTLRAAYAGIDNHAAGRSAARLLMLGHSRRRGVILPVLGSPLARDHADRLAGARALIEGTQEGLSLCAPLETRDDPGRMRAEITRAISENPYISGIYAIGAGNEGLFNALAECERARPLVVLHELLPETRAALEAGLIDAVIDQDPVGEVAQALAAMRALADGLPLPQRRLTPTVYLPDNLPPDTLSPLSAPSEELP